MISINPDNGVPIFEQIAAAIEHQVLSAHLKEGQLIPSVRELAVQIKVNPNTVAKAYQSLKNKGLVRFERGIGLRVCQVDSAEDRRRELLQSSLREAFQLGQRLGFSTQQIKTIANDLAKELHP